MFCWKSMDIIYYIKDSIHIFLRKQKSQKFIRVVYWKQTQVQRDGKKCVSFIQHAWSATAILNSSVLLGMSKQRNRCCESHPLKTEVRTSTWIRADTDSSLITKDFTMMDYEMNLHMLARFSQV